jgi:hypothetical protein
LKFHKKMGLYTKHTILSLTKMVKNSFLSATQMGNEYALVWKR